MSLITEKYSSRRESVMRKSHPKPLFSTIESGTIKSELSRPISMSAMISKIMFLTEDEDSTVSSKKNGIIIELYCLEF